MTTKNGTFEVLAESEPSLQEKKMTDRQPLIDKSNPLDGGLFEGLVRPCVGEFFGVMIFVFVGTLCVTGDKLIGVAAAHGLAIALLVACFAVVSGGHLNPAVTLGIYLSGGISTVKAILYVLSQLTGSIVGAALTRACLEHSVYVHFDGGALTLMNNTSPGQGILCEVILTNMLVLVVLLTAVDSDSKSPVAAVVIGFAVFSGILAGATVSGPAMNPARAFGPAIVVTTFNSSIWTYHYVYWLGPSLGAVLAAVMYRLFFSSPERRVITFGVN